MILPPKSLLSLDSRDGKEGVCGTRKTLAMNRVHRLTVPCSALKFGIGVEQVAVPHSLFNSMGSRFIYFFSSL